MCFWSVCSQHTLLCRSPSFCRTMQRYPSDCHLYIPSRRTKGFLTLLFQGIIIFLSEWKSLSRVDSLQPHGLQLTRTLCPQNSPGKNTGVGCHSLLLEIFPTQGWKWNPGLLHCRQILYQLSYQGNPWSTLAVCKSGCPLKAQIPSLSPQNSDLTSLRWSLDYFF